MKLIQKIMDTFDLTQERLALSSGVLQYRLSLITNNKARPSKTEKEKLERYFQTDSNILLGEIVDEKEH